MKKLLIVLVIFSIIASLNGCLKKRIEERGEFVMDNQIIPLEVNADKGIVAASSLKFNNRFACLNGYAEFALATIDEKLNVTFDVIRENTPGVDYTGIFRADETGKFMCCKSGWREVIMIDTESKKLIQKMASFNGNTYIEAFIPVVTKDKFVYVSIKEAKGPQNFSVFDFFQEEPVATLDIKNFYTILQGQGDSCLIEECFEDNNNYKWSDAILTKSGITFLLEDNLTKKLTKRGIASCFYSNKGHNLSKRMIIGRILDTVTHLHQPVSVRWNADKSDVKIEPLILQCPRPHSFEDKWEISPDGAWCMNKIVHCSGTKEEYYTIVFYQVGDAYPQGLSLPIHGDRTSEDNRGCFINHDVLGPLYLDINGVGDPVAYKLNQIPELLKNIGKQGMN